MMIKPLILAILALILPATSWAAIALVSHTESPDTLNVSSLSFSVVVPAGTDRLMAVCAQVRRSGTATTAHDITGITFNGTQSFTKVRSDDKNISGANPNRSELWYLVAPTVTTGNVAITWSGANQSAIGASATLLTGVSQTSPIDAQAGSNGETSTPNVTITTVADGAAILDCAMGRADGGLTVGAGQTVQTDRVLQPAGVAEGAGASTVTPKATAGAEVMNWTHTGAFGWVLSAVSFTPSGGTDPAPSAPVKATLSLTNGTDGVGVVSATFRRCTGLNCIPINGLITVPASNGTTITYNDTTVLLNTTYGYDAFNTDGAGNNSTAFPTIRYITTGTTFRNVLGVRDFSVLANAADIGADFTAGYTGYDACAIVSGTVRSINVNTACLESYNGVSTPNDQWAQATLPTFAGAVLEEAAIWCRLANAPTITGYAATLTLNPAAYTIYEVTAGAYAQLSTASAAAHANGDRYRFECEGTALRFYRIRGTAETLLTSATDGTITAGKTGVSLKVATSGTLADVQVNSYAMGGYSSTQDVAPTIIGLTADATGASLTYGAVTPTRIIVRLFNSQTGLDVEHPITDFPAGRFTQAWVAGWDGVCVLPVDSLGVTNTLTSAYQCRPFTFSTSIDTTPPVLSGCKPTGDLPSGTTSTIISCDLDKPAFCAFDTTDIPVLTMQTTLPMVNAGLKCSVNLTGLSAGAVTRYVGAYIEDSTDPSIRYPTVANQAVTFTILAAPAADTTDPSTVSDLTGTLSGLQATLIWPAATDNIAVAGYQVYQSTDGCVTMTLAGSPVAATSLQVNLTYGTAYCWQVKALDTSNRLSAAFSPLFSLTTGPFVDVIPPAGMSGLVVNCGFTAVCALGWAPGIDERTGVTTTIEICTVIAPSTDCSNFSVFKSEITDTTLSTDLAAGTSYCFRGRHSDGASVGGYSETVCGTTQTQGLSRPRADLRFGTTRAEPSPRSGASNRPVRP